MLSVSTNGSITTTRLGNLMAVLRWGPGIGDSEIGCLYKEEH